MLYIRTKLQLSTQKQRAKERSAESLDHQYPLFSAFSLNMADIKETSQDQNAETELTVLDDEINEKSLLRKLDGRLLPAVGVLYLLSFLDRSNGMIIQRQALNSANKSISWKCPY